MQIVRYCVIVTTVQQAGRGCVRRGTGLCVQLVTRRCMEHARFLPPAPVGAGGSLPPPAEVALLPWKQCDSLLPAPEEAVRLPPAPASSPRRAPMEAVGGLLCALSCSGPLVLL